MLQPDSRTVSTIPMLTRNTEIILAEYYKSFYNHQQTLEQFLKERIIKT